MFEHLKSNLMRPVAWLLAIYARLSSRRVGLAVVYHEVGEAADERGPRSAVLGAALFEAQLQHLLRRYRLVAARDLPDAVGTRRRGERIPVAVTLDDDVRSHLETAMPALRRLEVPATFFLTGASLQGPNPFSWERADEPGLRAEDVRELVAAGFEVGFHTRRHDPLPALDDAALARAMDEGREELAAAAGSEPTLIAYPHGKADARVAAAAQAAGYRLGFTGSGDPVSANSDPLLLSRRSASRHSAAHFALQLARVALQPQSAHHPKERGYPADP